MYIKYIIMKLYRKRDINKAGIYCIKNLINNKVYVGKSKNIYTRMVSHCNLLRNNSLDENRYLKRSWYKYGEDNFQYFVLEYLDENELLLKERELYWMMFLESTNRDKGYNLRIDTSTNCIVSEDTRKKLSESTKNRFTKFPELRSKLRKYSKKRWKDNREKMLLSCRQFSSSQCKYYILQYDKHSKELIKKWIRMKDILIANPSYKRHNIYAVCSGEKPSMYGYIWIKELISEDIVRTSEKSENLND